LTGVLFLLVCPGLLGALQWSENPPAPLPDIKGNHAAGVIDDEIYVAGGGCLGGFCLLARNTAYRYSPAGDVWTELPPLRERRAFPASAVVGGRFYVIGGADVTGFPFIEAHTTIEEFDPAAGSWRTLSARIPAGMAMGCRAVVVGDLVYLIGGHGDSLTLTREIHVFDPAADTVVSYTGDSLPNPRSEGSAVAVGRTIYYFGGWLRDYGVATATALALELDTGVWRQDLPPMPRFAAATAAIADGIRIYVLGGWNGSDQAFPDVNLYDIAADSWSWDSDLGCVGAVAGLTPGRAGLTVHRAWDGTEERFHAVGGAAGNETELSCHEATEVDPMSQDVTPPDFNGPVAAIEARCPDPPAVELTWPPALDLQSPPVSYNIYRGRVAGFLPDAATRIVAGLADTRFVDTDVVCIDQDPRPYFYIVRAQDSAAPPNEDPNLDRIAINVLCNTPSPPPDVGARLFVGKTDLLEPVLDWSSYAAPPDLSHYRVYRRLDEAGDLYAHPLDQSVPATYTDTAPAGRILFYKVRAVIDCMGVESAD